MGVGMKGWGWAWVGGGRLECMWAVFEWLDGCGYAVTNISFCVLEFCSPCSLSVLLGVEHEVLKPCALECDSASWRVMG